MKRQRERATQWRKKKAAAAAPLFLLLFLPKLTSSARSLHPFGSHTLSNQQIRRRGRAARVAACWYVEKKTNKKESLEALSLPLPSSLLNRLLRFSAPFSACLTPHTGLSVERVDDSSLEARTGGNKHNQAVIRGLE
jgi:hypothetical protein